MTAWLPTVITAVVTVFSLFAGPLQEFIATNPTLALILGGLATILASLLRSPIQK